MCIRDSINAEYGKMLSAMATKPLLLILLLAVWAQDSLAQTVDQDMDSYFGKMDKNKDGNVNMVELKDWLHKEHAHSIGGEHGYTDAEAKSFFSELDLNSDGKITATEAHLSNSAAPDFTDDEFEEETPTDSLEDELDSLASTYHTDASWEGPPPPTSR
eukprot:TRINITY_DN3796_c0_g4_i1.p2 TRINITY_DN3796_c0_g4~~TRINITY_DN3796_c0_g4_i1.p2  ORF type:complete len:159 (-),score=56.94 TRINITY_DN3796_c0_g4_i1:411-887(-)